MTQPAANLATAAIGKPLTAKEFGALIGRSAWWVCTMIKGRKLPTCPPHRRPYLIPRNVLFKFGVTEK